MDRVKFFATLSNMVLYILAIGNSNWFFMFTIWAYMAIQAMIATVLYFLTQKHLKFNYYVFSIWTVSNLLTFLIMYLITTA